MCIRDSLRTVERINEIEDSIDKMEDNINNYLLRINEEEITEDESKDVTLLLRPVSYTHLDVYKRQLLTLHKSLLYNI